MLLDLHLLGCSGLAQGGKSGVQNSPGGTFPAGIGFSWYQGLPVPFSLSMLLKLRVFSAWVGVTELLEPVHQINPGFFWVLKDLWGLEMQQELVGVSPCTPKSAPINPRPDFWHSLPGVCVEFL